MNNQLILQKYHYMDQESTRKKVYWKKEDDERLKDIKSSQSLSKRTWIDISNLFNIQSKDKRNPKQCQQRWNQILNPRLNKAVRPSNRIEEKILELKISGKQWLDILTIQEFQSLSYQNIRNKFYSMMRSIFCIMEKLLDIKKSKLNQIVIKVYEIMVQPKKIKQLVDDSDLDFSILQNQIELYKHLRIYKGKRMRNMKIVKKNQYFQQNLQIIKEVYQKIHDLNQKYKEKLKKQQNFKTQQFYQPLDEINQINLIKDDQFLSCPIISDMNEYPIINDFKRTQSQLTSENQFYENEQIKLRTSSNEIIFFEDQKCYQKKKYYKENMQLKDLSETNKKIQDNIFKGQQSQYSLSQFRGQSYEAYFNFDD